MFDHGSDKEEEEGRDRRRKTDRDWDDLIEWVIPDEKKAFLYTKAILGIMPSPASHIDTEMEYWYGSKEVNARKNDIVYARKAFPQIKVKELEGYQHAQLVLVHPKEFCREAMRFLG